MIGARRAAVISSGIRWLLRATFSTDIAAPLPASLPVDVGGPLTVVQVDGQFSQSGGKLVFPAQATPVWGDQGLYDSTARSRVAGRAVLATINRASTSGFGPVFGWSTLANGNNNGFTSAAPYFSNGGNFLVGSVNATVGSYVGSIDYQCLTIQRAVGTFVFIKGGIYANWTLLWVDNSGSAPLYPVFANYDASGTLDNFRVLDLGSYDSRFAADEGLATARIASNNAGDTITQTADAWVEQTLTAATGVDKDLYVRWTDDNNCWIVRQNQAGSTVKLIEKVAGVETSRGSTATTYTNAVAYRHIAICEGSVIKVYVDTTLKITYSSASFQATATTARAPSVGTEFKSYPRTVTLPSGI